MTETLTFKSRIQKRPVVIQVEDDKGKVASEKKFELREMTAAQRDQYLTDLQSRFRLNKDGVAVGMKDFIGLQANLLSLCMFNEQGEPVSRDDVQTWPASCVTQLFKAAKEINHLADETKAAELESAKND